MRVIRRHESGEMPLAGLGDRIARTSGFCIGIKTHRVIAERILEVMCHARIRPCKAKSGKFNRATQAQRQPGSGFKPFLYSAALENGFTAASLILDAPFVIDDTSMEEAWRPENSSGEFYGPTRLREALVKSRNLVSIRLLQAVGMSPAMAWAERFGFERARLPRNLTLALGTNSATPLQVATAYAVFANGGYRVQPWFIDRIEDPKGEVVFQAAPRRAGCDAEDNAAGATGCNLPEALRAPRAPLSAIPRRPPRAPAPSRC